MGRGTPMQPSLVANVGFFPGVCQIHSLGYSRTHFFYFFYFLLGSPKYSLGIWVYYRGRGRGTPRSRVQRGPPYASAGQPGHALASRGSDGGVMASRGSDGMRWPAGAAMASRGSDGQPGQRWHAMAV